MSIETCDKHGRYDTDEHHEGCPRCTDPQEPAERGVVERLMKRFEEAIAAAGSADTATADESREIEATIIEIQKEIEVALRSRERAPVEAAGVGEPKLYYWWPEGMREEPATGFTPMIYKPDYDKALRGSYEACARICDKLRLDYPDVTPEQWAVRAMAHECAEAIRAASSGERGK